MQAWVYFTPILAAGLVTAIVTTVLRLKNAGLTEAQLFLRFWKLWAALIILDLPAMAGSIYWLVSQIP